MQKNDGLIQEHSRLRQNDLTYHRQVILDFDLKTEFTSTYDVIPRSSEAVVPRNLEYKPISDYVHFISVSLPQQ